eukprot:12718937-Alexandrium_andersonii.AAC.1
MCIRDRVGSPHVSPSIKPNKIAFQAPELQALTGTPPAHWCRRGKCTALTRLDVAAWLKAEDNSG